MASRRRRTKVTWLPNLGTPAGGDTKLAIQGFGFQVPQDFSIERVIIPLTWDEPIDEEQVTPAMTSLADLQGSAYHITRVVGNIQVTRSDLDGTEQEVTGPVAFAAALAVVPWDDHSNTPEADVNPLDASDIREPWMWRRYTTFGTDDLPATGTDTWLNAWGTLPNNTRDMPQSRFEYIDQKTSRFVSGSERLCLIVAGALLDPSNYNAGPYEFRIPYVTGTFDYRILGSLRRARNDGTVR